MFSSPICIASLSSLLFGFRSFYHSRRSQSQFGRFRLRSLRLLISCWHSAFGHVDFCALIFLLASFSYNISHLIRQIVVTTSLNIQDRWESFLFDLLSQWDHICYMAILASESYFWELCCCFCWFYVYTCLYLNLTIFLRIETTGFNLNHRNFCVKCCNDIDNNFLTGRCFCFVLKSRE